MGNLNVNSVTLIGRLAKDPELRYVGENNKAWSRFTLAIGRDFKQQNGEYKTDFIEVVLWGKQAETSYKYLSKGRQILVQGRIETDNYVSSTGDKKYVTRVVGEKFKFADSKREEVIENKGSFFDRKTIFTDNENNELELDELPF